MLNSPKLFLKLLRTHWKSYIMVVKKYLLTNLTADAVVFKVRGETDADVERLFSGALYTLQKSQLLKLTNLTQNIKLNIRLLENS